ncbi:MAG: beta-N-acetylhexosaminidase [Ruminococcaceae bacterium]|nr:beta-N-acetylhexosaminidase [Oscillospiraceae bacterium]
MKLKFVGAEKVISGIEIIKEDIGIEIGDADKHDIEVTVKETDKPIVKVELEGNAASITYGDGIPRFLRGLAILASWIKNGERKKTVIEDPIFKSNGAMFDMSRNAVMKVDTVKLLLRKMALMGLNTFMLYTEDTYEIEEYPYFGYMRGRYTKDEIRELDKYALALGIELIPCIQMLGHLATHLIWAASSEYKDTAKALLVGSAETEKLMRAMLGSISSAFTSRRIHVGMDETHDLGTGRYLDINGYKDRQDIYFEHLGRVVALCREYGFKPMMWSDMFFKLAGRNIPNFYDYHPDVEFTDEVISKIPDGIQQVFWDYYHQDEEFYRTNIEKHHSLFGDDSLFAGGIWMWSGHCPLYSRSLAFTVPALDACRKGHVREVVATVWHNGAESMPIMALAGLAWYADYDYKGGFDLESAKECFKFATGLSYDAVINCDKPEFALDNNGNMLSVTRALLYNDPLMGIVDRHLRECETDSYYSETTRLLAASEDAVGFLAPAYRTVEALSSLLENKASFGVRLKAAYDAKDNEMLSAAMSECELIIEKIKHLKDTHKRAWMEYNKALGWEIHDIRYGGLIARFETTKERIQDYLNGRIDRIEELEETRLLIDGRSDTDAKPIFGTRFLWYTYRQLATPNIL